MLRSETFPDGERSSLLRPLSRCVTHCTVSRMFSSSIKMQVKISGIGTKKGTGVHCTSPSQNHKKLFRKFQRRNNEKRDVTKFTIFFACSLLFLGEKIIFFAL